LPLFELSSLKLTASHFSIYINIRSLQYIYSLTSDFSRFVLISSLLTSFHVCWSERIRHLSLIQKSEVDGLQIVAQINVPLRRSLSYIRTILVFCEVHEKHKKNQTIVVDE
jgi:hypothetical protein